jgi:hypothetical protein
VTAALVDGFVANLGLVVVKLNVPDGEAGPPSSSLMGVSPVRGSAKLLKERDANNGSVGGRGGRYGTGRDGGCGSMVETSRWSRVGSVTSRFEVL